MGPYLIAAGCFAAGFVLGGLIVYSVNVRKWHLEDLDEILAVLERIDSNNGRINANVKKAVTRFGDFTAVFDNYMKATTEHVSKIDLNVRQNVRGSTDALKEVAENQVAIKEKLDEMRAVETATSENAERILERVKLLG